MQTPLLITLWGGQSDAFCADASDTNALMASTTATWYVMLPSIVPRGCSLTDVITTSASQQTRVDFSVSNPKARDEGGRDENCRLRSPCTATKHSHGRYRNRRVDGEGIEA